MKTTRIGLLILSVLLLLCLSLAACDSGDTTPDTTVGDTTAPVTDAPTEEPTAAPTEPVTEAPTATPTEEPTEPAKSGCGSAVTFGLAAILVAAAVTVIRKKD